MRCLRIASLCLLALPFPGAAFGAGDIDALLLKSVEEYGGEEALSKMAFRQEGKAVSAARGGAAGTLVRAYEYPGRLRVDVACPGGEREVGVPELPLSEGMTLAAEIDPETGRILRSSGRSRPGHTNRPGAGRGGSATVEFVTEHADFRRVDRLLFAFRERSYATETRTGDTVLTRAEVLRTLPPSTFAP